MHNTTPVFLEMIMAYIRPSALKRKALTSKHYTYYVNLRLVRAD